MVTNLDAQFDAAISDAQAMRAAAVTDISEPMITPDQTDGGPPVGTVRGGFRFTGGDPNDSNNWEPI